MKSKLKIFFRKISSLGEIELKNTLNNWKFVFSSAQQGGIQDLAAGMAEKSSGGGEKIAPFPQRFAFQYNITNLRRLFFLHFLGYKEMHKIHFFYFF